MTKIPFSPPDIREEDIERVVAVLRSGWITTGPETKAFERELSAYTGAAGTACLNSATAAMELCLRWLGVGPGDEVVTSAYTYTASASVVDHVGATIVLADTAPGDYLPTAADYAACVTPKTRAIIPVDVAGRMVDHAELMRLLGERRAGFEPRNARQEALGRVAVIADAAHSLGARLGGRMCGEIADFTCFSFHAVKNLTTAEGGAVCWNRAMDEAFPGLYQDMMLLSLHGQNKDALAKTRAGAWAYDIVEPAWKCNMTDIQAALGRSQLARYEELLERRHAILARYAAGLAGTRLELMPHPAGERERSSAHLAIYRLAGADEEERNRFIEDMGAAGIACNVHYQPLPLLAAYRALGFDAALYPHAMAAYRSEVTLPLHTLLSDADVERVVETAGRLAGPASRG
ncbi:MAG: DegT/DnrJ/EryC1/StrS family aminotransferase [Bacillota bacterium]|nr:DegT/DnrJ/EryC1/StrS family aminotransferase [Bacillota bacterium]